MKTKILHIEKLRGISILLVLLFHLEIPGFQFGYLGVDIFFVISGFLMASLYGDIATRPQIANFLLRRCARILPAYFVVILIAVLYGIFTLLPHEVDMLLEQSLWSVFLLPNFGFWQGAAYFDYTLFRPLLNLWSLGVELQFYLLFPLLLFVERNSQRLLVLVVGLSLLEYGVFSSIDPRNAFFLLPGRIWEFMAGFYVCRYAATGREGNPLLGSLCLVGLIAGILVLPLISVRNDFVLACVAILLSVAMVWHGFTTGSERNFLSRSLLLLGKYSYSVYLVHFPIIVFINYVPFEGTNLAASNAQLLVLSVLVIGVFSALLHHTIELPTRKSLTPKSLFLTSVLFCGAIAVLSVLAPAMNRSSHSVEAINVSGALLDRDMSRCERSAVGSLLRSYSCLAGDSQTNPDKRFLLHGDSHSDGIKLPLAEVLNARGYELRITVDYAPINSVNDSGLVLAEAVDQDVDVIILHSLPQADNGAALESFILSARENGLLVAFIGPVPTYDFDIPKKLALDLREGITRVPTGVELQSHLERNRLLFSTLTQLDASYDNFVWYQTSDYLCSEYCEISSESWVPYYFDSNHLTLTGARLLAPIFESLGSL